LIKIADYGGPNGGTLGFHFTYAPTVPANDLCGSATLIGSTDGSFHPAPFCTPAATLPARGTNANRGMPHANHAWYRFVPCGNGTINLNTLGSNYDTNLAVFTGSCAAANQLVCNNDFTISQQSVLSNVPVTAGTTYLIRVANHGNGPAGTLKFNF